MHCANTVHIGNKSNRFWKVSDLLLSVELNKVNGHTDLWMFGAHHMSVVPLVDTMKAMASKIPHTVFKPEKHLDP